MNTFSHDASGWIYQQDYLTFLAVLGWITTGLIAWGNAAGGTGTQTVPWKLFAAFCLFAAIDGALDLARMVTPQISSPEFEAIFRLIGYGLLLEFSRRTAAQLGWVRLPAWLPTVLASIAQAILILWPASAPVPEVIIGSLAGVSAAVVIIATVGAGSRMLLATAASLLLLGPVEILRQQGGVTIDGLYGLFITGEGIETAICACVLAWVAGFGLWLHGVLRRRTFFAGHPEMDSPLAVVVLPLVILATLVCGYFLVNWSSDRARSEIERAYLNNVSTAALAIDPEMVSEAWSNGTVDVASDAAFRISQQVRGLLGATDLVARVYIWNITGGRVAPPREWLAGSEAAEPAIVKVGGDAISRLRGRQLLGPIGSKGDSVIIATAPIITRESADAVAWLGLDFTAREWLAAQAGARLQTIALVGLFSSLIVFFLAHQMLREHEAELLLAKESAEAADRAKDEFLAVMSHEIRTPMQSVLGYGELMARTPLSAAQGGYLDAIRSQGRTLLRIVQDILDFSILRKSSYTLKTERVFLHRLVETAYETLKPLAARKSLRFDLTIANDVPEVVVGDGVRIEQILLNLAGNAVKFTDVGSVQIDVACDGEEKSAGRVMQRVRFSISDTGMGIRQADVRRLFEPFTRLSYAEATPKEGAGLGLAIVKRLCQLMGGTIDLESEWGKGTRFIVRIPFQPVEADAALAAAELPTLLGPQPPVTNLGQILPLRVLVVEDNPFIRRLMVEYLRSIGYSPTALTNGAEAVDHWQEADLLIMDLRMPGMDGVTAAARIRAASGSDSHPWIIGVSATLSEGEIQRAMLAGMNDFLGKPFFVQSLIEAIQASPMFARVKSGAPQLAEGAGEPGADDDHQTVDTAAVDPAGAAAGADDDPIPEPPPGVMSWMPDLSANGETDVVKQAVEEIPGLLDEIGGALDAGNLEHAAERAHYLKNTIFALRMEPMVAPCRAVYERSQNGDASSARQSLETLRAAFAAWTAERIATGAGDPKLEA